MNSPNLPSKRPSFAEPFPAIRSLVARLPVWAIVMMALLCVGAGVVLTLSPFTSAGALALLVGLNAIVTGMLLFVGHEEHEGGALPASSALLGLGWLLLGVVILARPGLSVVALAIVVGLALVVTGLLDVARVVSGRRQTERAETFIGGLAALVFGVLALSWRDVTILVVAVLFGARTVLFGLSQMIAITKPWWDSKRESAQAAPALPRWARRGLRVASRAVALVVAVALLAVSVTLHRGAPSSTVPAFYDWTGPAPSAPGKLLRSEPLTADSIPRTAQGWRILYSTRTSLGAPAIGSGFVLAPKELPAGPRPVILWVHGTEGIARGCAPSLFSNVTLGIPATPTILALGWVMVAPDYIGMGTVGPMPYLIGTGEAYSSLDAIRAAHQLAPLTLSDQTVVWGHSQGGHAALWTGMLAATYAPELRIAGIAALAPATDLVPLGEQVQFSVAGTVVAAYLIVAYSTTYSEVRFDDYVRPGARVQVTQAARRCISDPRLAASVIAGVGGRHSAGRDFASGALGDRLRQNTPDANLGGIPLFVAQGTSDEVISIALNQAWVSAQCAAGFKLAFKTYLNLTHVGLLSDRTFTIDLLRWTVARFAGAPAPNTC